MQYLVVCLIVLSISPPSHSQIIHDGSLGRAGAVNGNPALIQPIDGPLPSDVRGLVKGQNVFYSFSQFDLAKGQAARFQSNNAQIRNVLARVTAGRSSSIDGTIELTDAGVNLFMMNPAGFIFGPNARLDVKGSVLFTSADYIRFADNATFDAKFQVSEVLSSAAPAAFGFLGPQAPAAIRIDGIANPPTTVNVPNGAVLSFVGGEINASNVRLVATAGRINLISSGGGGGEARFDASDAKSAVDTTEISSGGAIRLRDSASARVTVGGSLVARGASLLLDGSDVAAQTDTKPGGAVDIDIEGRFESLASGINIATQGPADGGAVTIKADEVIVRGRNFATGLSTAINAETKTSGKGSNVTINARTIEFSHGGNITTATSGSGGGGNMILNASERVTLDGSATQGLLTGVSSETSSSSFPAGRAGDVTITAPRVEILGSAQITSKTKSFGAAGKVEINCDQLLIDGSGTGSLTFTGIEARVGDDFGNDPGGVGQGAPGPGGIVKIDADQMTLRNGGVITASTFGIGNAGGMRITTERLALRGSKSHRFTGLFARTTKRDGAGDGGNINLTAGVIDIFGRASMSASSEGSDGDAGGIDISASGPITLSHGGAINVSSDRTNGGNISIAARRSAVQLFDAGQITTRAAQNGGNVLINADSVSLSQSEITGQAGGNGGFITLTTDATSLGDESRIDGTAVGPDVNVTLRGQLLQSIDSQILSDNASFTLDTDIASSIVPFDADVTSAIARLQDFCGIRVSRISSFTVTGRGGLTLDPARPAPAEGFEKR